MKKRLLIIILSAVAVLIVGGSILLQQHFNDSDKPEEGKTISIGISGYDEYNIAHDVKKMTIHNAYGTFSFTPDPTVDGIEDKSWFLDDLDGMKSSYFAVNDIALAYYTITASTALTVSAEDYTTYGFDVPELEVTIEFNDGNVYTYSFGTSVGLSDFESDYYCYVMRSGDDTVYLVESYFYEKAFISLKDVMKTELYPQLESNATIYELTLSGAQGDSMKIKSYEDNFMAYYFVEPYTRDTDRIAMSNLLNQIDIIDTGVVIEAAGTKDMPILENALHMYGLDDPARVLNFKYTVENTETAEDGTILTVKEQGEHTLRLGIVYDNLVYVMADDLNAIFSVPYSLLSAVYEASFDSLAARNIYAEKLISIEEMKFDTAFKTFHYKITATTEVNSVTLNGKSIDVSAVKSLYSKFASMTYSERTDKKQTAEPYITITVKLTTGKTDVIKFTEFNARRYYVTINGQGDLLVSYELVDELLEALKTTDKTPLG